jgi:hypothetical protein
MKWLHQSHSLTHISGNRTDNNFKEEGKENSNVSAESNGAPKSPTLNRRTGNLVQQNADLCTAGDRFAGAGLF